MKVLCIDLKSFYASVECVLRNLDPFATNLVVADPARGGGSVILAVTPYLKEQGVPSRCRLHELPKDLDIIVARPRMQKYIDFASRIYQVYLKYVAAADIHVYSIDEAFLDISSYMSYYKVSTEELALTILNDIYDTTGVRASAGIGDNMFLAKVALDCLAKKTPNGIFYLNEEKFKRYIWDIQPLTAIWGIGAGIAKRLSKRNMHSMRDIACADVEELEREFGVIGRELYEHAHGRDDSTVTEVQSYRPQAKTFGASQILFRDYHFKEILVILSEMIDDVVCKLVANDLSTQLIELGIGYSKAIGGGFYKQRTLDSPTFSKKELLDAFYKLYHENVQFAPIRKVMVRVGKLTSEHFVQTDLFSIAKDYTKEKQLYLAINQVKRKFGANAIHLAISYTNAGTKVLRNRLIGGHNAN